MVQGLNAIGAQFLQDPLRREVATILSVIGGIVIALQDKSSLMPIVSAYNHVSNTYTMLASQAKAKLQEAEMIPDNDQLHHRDRILEFSEHCVKIENNAKDCPTMVGLQNFYSISDFSFFRKNMLNQGYTGFHRSTCA